MNAERRAYVAAEDADPVALALARIEGDGRRVEAWREPK